MRIAFVAYHGSVHTRRWVAFFAARGHEVHVITAGDSASAHDNSTPARYRVHDVGPPRLGKIGYFAKLWAVRRLVRKLNPDVVHAHFATSYGMLAAAAAGKRPLVVTAHGDDVLISPQRLPLRLIVRRVLRRADVVTVPAEHMRHAVEQLAQPTPPQVHVFQYGVETERLAQLGKSVRAAASGGQARPIRIVSARALLSLYRVDVVLDAMSLLVRDGLDARLVLAGDGPERANLELRTQQLQLEPYVTFLGHLSSDQVEQEIAGADVYVTCAESDGVSLALLEAMALGAVPVASDIPANRAWIDDGVNGTLAAIEPDAFAMAIRRALELTQTHVWQTNIALVAGRADRTIQLGACELLLDELCNVSFEREPGRERHEAA